MHFFMHLLVSTQTFASPPLTVLWLLWALCVESWGGAAKTSAVGVLSCTDYSFAVQAIAVVILCTSHNLIPVSVLSVVASAVAVVLASMLINMATKTTNLLQLIQDDPRSSVLRKERLLCLLACVAAFNWRQICAAFTVTKHCGQVGVQTARCSCHYCPNGQCSQPAPQQRQTRWKLRPLLRERLPWLCRHRSRPCARICPLSRGMTWESPSLQWSIQV
jgi:hypothetical protein